MSLISALARTMATALQRLRQNHKQNEEVDLLHVFILCCDVVCGPHTSIHAALLGGGHHNLRAHNPMFLCSHSSTRICKFHAGFGG